MDCLGGYLHQNERGWHTTRICSCSDKLYAPSLISAGQSTKQIISNHDPFVNMLKTAEFPRKSLQSRDLGHASECLCQVGLQPREALEIPRGCRAGEIGPRTGTWAKVPCLTVLAGVPWCFDCLWFRSYWLHLGSHRPKAGVFVNLNFKTPTTVR